MIIVGLGGLKGVGKDTVAQYLVDHYGFQRASLADPIKRLLNDRFGWPMALWEDREWKETVDGFTFSPRSWAQWLGTEVGRTIGGQDVWVEMLFDELHGTLKDDARVVISDCRFQNEVHAVRDENGFSICLVDPARDDSPEHVSEDLDPNWYDYDVPAIRGDFGTTFQNVDIVMHLECVDKVKGSK